MEIFKNINADTMYKFIGISVFLFISIYITGQCLNYQNYVIEGLTQREKNINKDTFQNLDQEIKNINEQQKDSLYVTKYKPQYEDILIGINEHSHLKLLHHMTEYSNAAVQKDSKKQDEHLNSIIKMNELNKSTNSCMKYLNNL